MQDIQSPGTESVHINHKDEKSKDSNFWQKIMQYGLHVRTTIIRWHISNFWAQRNYSAQHFREFCRKARFTHGKKERSSQGAGTIFS